MSAKVIPISDRVARLLSPPTGGVRFEAVVGGGICFTWRNDDGEVDLYFGIDEAAGLARQLADAIDLAAELVRAEREERGGCET
jgi:hypothetical protein